MSNMNPLDYLALIYVNKNSSSGQSASELSKMFFEAKAEISKSYKEAHDKKSSSVNVKIIK